VICDEHLPLALREPTAADADPVVLAD
jgi:hypothetical protein